jgi:hypothetical protein
VTYQPPSLINISAQPIEALSNAYVPVVILSRFLYPSTRPLTHLVSCFWVASWPVVTASTPASLPINAWQEASGIDLRVRGRKRRRLLTGMEMEFA